MTGNRSWFILLRRDWASMLCALGAVVCVVFGCSDERNVLPPDDGAYSKDVTLGNRTLTCKLEALNYFPHSPVGVDLSISDEDSANVIVQRVVISLVDSDGKKVRGVKHTDLEFDSKGALKIKDALESSHVSGSPDTNQVLPTGVWSLKVETWLEIGEQQFESDFEFAVEVTEFIG